MTMMKLTLLLLTASLGRSFDFHSSGVRSLLPDDEDIGYDPVVIETTAGSKPFNPQSRKHFDSFSPKMLDGSGYPPAHVLDDAGKLVSTFTPEAEPTSVQSYQAIKDVGNKGPFLPCNVPHTEDYLFNPPKCWRSDPKMYSRLQCRHSTNDHDQLCSCVRAVTGERSTRLKSTVGNCSIALISVKLVISINKIDLTTGKKAFPIILNPNSESFQRFANRYTAALRSLFRVEPGEQDVEVKSVRQLDSFFIEIEGVLHSVGHDNVNDVVKLINSRIDEGLIESLRVTRKSSAVYLRTISEEVPYPPYDGTPSANNFQGNHKKPTRSDNESSDESKFSSSGAVKSYPKESYFLLKQPGIIAAIVGGGLVGLLLTILLLLFLIYRVRKRDEGSYALDEPKKLLKYNMYQRAPDREFYA